MFKLLVLAAGVIAVQVATAQGRYDTVFTNIDLLCGALKSDGLSTRPWKSIGGTDYQCITPYVDIGTPGPTGMQTNIAYYVTGLAPKRANSLKIVLNVNNLASRKLGKLRLRAATNTLFSKIGIELPAGLIPAVVAEKPF